MTSPTRLAVDIGGTFTDLVLALPDRTLSAKLLTTPESPDQAVIAGTQAILAEAGIDAEQLDLVIHGTTLATNALIERKGARTALITTRGFRDSLEIAYEHRFEQYDLYMERPTPLVERDLRLEVPERLAADGSVLLELDEAALEALVPVLRQHRIEAVAISFLHSYVKPAHEARARALLSRAMPELAITISAEVCREIREYERTSTTVANAYVLPLMDHYLARMQDGLRALGAACPLLLMMSSGGICTMETARRFPVRLVESGPAGGAILARHVAARGGYDRALAFDMGGTTAKASLVRDGEATMAEGYYVGGYASGHPVMTPVVDVVEVGAHEREGFALSLLRPSQPGNRAREAGVGSEVKTADALDGEYPSPGELLDCSNEGVAVGRLAPGVYEAKAWAARRAGVRLGMKATVGGILELDPAGAALREVDHRGPFPVEGRVLDDRVARTAGRAGDEGIEVAPVRRIEQLRSALRTQCEVGWNRRKGIGRFRAPQNCEAVETLRRELLGCDGVDSRGSREGRCNCRFKAFDRAARPFELGDYLGAPILNVPGKPAGDCRAVDEWAEADALDDSPVGDANALDRRVTVHCCASLLPLMLQAPCYPCYLHLRVAGNMGYDAACMNGHWLSRWRLPSSRSSRSIGEPS